MKELDAEDAMKKSDVILSKVVKFLKIYEVTEGINANTKRCPAVPLGRREHASVR
jgi:hypothetical protein